MRVAQTEEAAKPIVELLQPVAEFLNAVGPETTRDQWRAYLKTYLTTHDRPGRFITFVGNRQARASVTLSQAKEVRQFIVSDLRYLYFDRERIRTTESPFGPLTLRLNEQFKAGSWHCAALGSEKAEPGQAVLTRKRQDGTTERWATTFLPFREVRTLKERFYAILGRALLTGTLTRLKLCQQCGRYFVAVKDRKRDFCEGTTCKDDFHNQQEEREGYYRNRRQNERKDAIKKALNLKYQGAGFKKIQAETNLPNREVNRVLEEED
jgi:hypothetical protein